MIANFIIAFGGCPSIISKEKGPPSEAPLPVSLGSDQTLPDTVQDFTLGRIRRITRLIDPRRSRCSIHAHGVVLGVVPDIVFARKIVEIGTDEIFRPHLRSR